MSTKTPTKTPDPLFTALEARLEKQDKATRAARAQKLQKALEAQITGAVVLPANAASIPNIDPGRAAVGCRGIFWNGGAFDRDFSGECTGFSDGRYLDNDGDKYDHFLSVESILPETFK